MTSSRPAASQIARLREVMQVLHRYVGALQRDEICCHGVTIPQCYTLQILDRDGEMTAGELAQRLGVEASTMTRSADVLVRQGAVARVRPETGDRRRVLLRLTREGRALTRKLIACGDDCFETLLRQIPAEERADMLDALGRLTAALDRMRAGGGEYSSECCTGRPDG